jgi:primase-polymerase (primpol)-like protein
VTTFDNIPDELKSYRQWIVWRYEDHGGPKPTKVPYSPNFPGHAAVDKPGTWASFDEAVRSLQRWRRRRDRLRTD